MLSISIEGIRLIQYYESCKLKTYLCSAGKPTIGWGHTGADVKMGMVITQARADELLRLDLAQFEKDVRSLLKVTVTQKQFDALVCFAFNVGSDIDADTIAEGLGDSSLLKYVNAGQSSKAADEFLKWNKADGSRNKKDDDGDGVVDEAGEKQKVRGLTKRRAAERALFNGAAVEGAIRVGEAAA